MCSRCSKKIILSQFVDPMPRSTLTDAIRAQHKCAEKSLKKLQKHYKDKVYPENIL